MGRLTGKNLLIIIPKDYYNEEELNIPLEIFKKEDANIVIASPKMKEAVGEKNGRVMPNVLVVDAIEGIVGDSYVTGSRGTRQVKGIFHGVVVVGGKGARLYTWKDNLVRLLLNDRYRSGFVVAAIGMGVGALALSGLIESQEVAAPEDKKLTPLIEKSKSIVADENLVSYNRIITAKDATVATSFAEAVIAEVEKTAAK